MHEFLLCRYEINIRGTSNIPFVIDELRFTTNVFYFYGELSYWTIRSMYYFLREIGHSTHECQFQVLFVCQKCISCAFISHWIVPRLCKYSGRYIYNTINNYNLLTWSLQWNYKSIRCPKRSYVEKGCNWHEQRIKKSKTCIDMNEKTK